MCAACSSVDIVQLHTNARNSCPCPGAQLEHQPGVSFEVLASMQGTCFLTLKTLPRALTITRSNDAEQPRQEGNGGEECVNLLKSLVLEWQRWDRESLLTCIQFIQMND